MTQVDDAITKELLSLPERFFGSVEIVFQDGFPVLIKTIETKKLSPGRNNRGTTRVY
jgi:hypothetical protein